MTDRETPVSKGRLRMLHQRSRVMAGAMMVVLAAALTIVGTPSAARAADEGCPAGLQWIYYDNGWFPEYNAVQYVVDSVTPAFLVSEERVVVNSTGTPITASFTSSVAKTFTLSVTVGATAKLFDSLTATVSSSITMSTTTTTGVSATAPVPAYGRVIGQFGVEAYNVSYTVKEYNNIGNNPPGPLCSLTGSTHGTSVAPTVYTGWRVLPG